MRYMNHIEAKLPVMQQWIIFSDEEMIADYAMNALQTLYKLGIIDGEDDNRVDPRSRATRGFTASALHKLLEAVGR